MNEDIKNELIKENEYLLQEIHARHYTGADDDMPDAFENWICNLTVDELEGIINKEKETRIL